MSPGAQLCQLPGPLSVSASQSRKLAVTSGAAFSPSCSCTPSQIEQEPQYFPGFVPAHALELVSGHFDCFTENHLSDGISPPEEQSSPNLPFQAEIPGSAKGAPELHDTCSPSCNGGGATSQITARCRFQPTGEMALGVIGNLIAPS